MKHDAPPQSTIDALACRGEPSDLLTSLPLPKSHVVLCLSLLSTGIIACGGGAQLVLKSPIEEKCASAGLNGCHQIAEGATLYADGNAPEGEKRLGEGLAANSEKIAQLKKFADALAMVGKIPGAGQYVAPLQPAIALVQQAAAKGEAAAAEKAKLARTESSESASSGSSIQSPERQSMLETTTSIVRATLLQSKAPQPVATFWITAGNALASPCRFAGMAKMLCLHEAVDEPKVVTDVMISAACPVDVLVASRVALNFDWLVYAPAGKGAEVHGAKLPLAVNRTFTISTAQAGAKGEELPLDIRCGVTTVWHAASADPAPKGKVAETSPKPFTSPSIPPSQ